MYAYKDAFGGVSKTLKYICCSLMDLFPSLEVISGTLWGTELKQTHSLVKDLFYAVMEWATLWPQRP